MMSKLIRPVAGCLSYVIRSHSDSVVLVEEYQDEEHETKRA